MTLEALILRADGVVAETDEIERSILNRVLQAAGLDGTCSRADYRDLSRHSNRRERFRHYLRKTLDVKRSAEDIELLLDAMCRHAGTVMRDYLEKEFLEPRVGIRELAAAARADGLKVGVISALPDDEAQLILTALFGGAAQRLFSCVATAAKGGKDDALRNAYLTALEQLGADPASSMALEATIEGSRTARASGIPAVILVGHDGADRDKNALFAIDDLSDLVRGDDEGDKSFLTPGDGAEILSALRRAHAGYFDLFGKLHRSYVMKVSDILKDKGSQVKTVQATDTMLTLAQRLKADNVGAMVVIGPGGRLDGIISERDLATGLANHGPALTGMMVGDLMTKAVVTCSPDDAIAAVAKIMTQRRFRHMPVEQDGKLIGLVSIGDVLKHRLDELQLETNVLRDFVIARG